MTNANRRLSLYSQKYISNLRQAVRANKFLKIDKLFFEDFPAPNLDIFSSTKITSAINKYIFKLKISKLLLPYYGDLHHDHSKISYAGLVASRPFSKINQVFFMKLYLKQNGAIHIILLKSFVSFDKKILEKITSFKIYKSQNKNKNHPRSVDGIRALAKFRGLSVCRDFAEAFKIFRYID